MSYEQFLFLQQSVQLYDASNKNDLSHKILSSRVKIKLLKYHMTLLVWFPVLRSSLCYNAET